MKKIFLLLTVIFATASGSFAWTGSQSLSAWGYQNGPDPGITDIQTVIVNINAYCNTFEFTGSVNTGLAPVGSNPFAAAFIYNSSYSVVYNYGYLNAGDSKSVYYFESDVYWTTAGIYLEAYLAAISVTLQWDAL